MCGDIKDVEANHSIGSESPNRMDPWKGWASQRMEDENGEAAKNDKELERYERLMLGGRE